MTQSIIDTHVHYWHPTRLRYPWLDDEPALNKPVLTDSIPVSGDGWQVEKIVFVQAGCLDAQGMDEVNFVTELAQQDSRIQGIVAFAPLEVGVEVRAALDQLRKNPLVKGVRRLIQSEVSGFCIQPAFIEAVQLLPDYGFTFDLCIRHYQLPDVITLVQQCPQTGFVLDHLGKPGINAGMLDPWREHITTLAQLPNVGCKISGMIPEADLQHWQPADLTPYIEHVIGAFGIERVMFGSDSPVFRVANATCEQWVGVLLNAVAGLSDAEKQQLFYDNAATFYRL
ncbi:MAG: amidohydrolase family protein [Anaerolineae bacterium]|nr:amidohydrolase family protein [Anaerolineae bacterium]